jgi:hypothetical protein
VGGTSGNVNILGGSPSAGGTGSSILITAGSGGTADRGNT